MSFSVLLPAAIRRTRSLGGFVCGRSENQGTGAHGRSYRPDLLQGEAPASTASERASAALGRRSAGLHSYDKSCKLFRSEQIEDPKRTLHISACFTEGMLLTQGLRRRALRRRALHVAPCGAVSPQFSRVKRGTAAGAGARLADEGAGLKEEGGALLTRL